MSRANIGQELEQGIMTEPSATPVGLCPVAAGALIAYGNTVPTDTASGYAIGCIFIHTDGGNGTALYVNEGTAGSCDFNAITVA